nr:helix-turn-helix domain-containing protein [Streptomyces hoynatensis]
MEQPGFGRRLKAMRLARGLSQRSLAGDGMSTGYLSRLESGARPPTKQAVAYLAERLGVSPAEFRETETPSLARAIAEASYGETPEAVTVLDKLVATASDEDPALLWQAHWILAEAKRRHGDHEAEAGYLHRLVELSDEPAVPELQVRARTQLARCRRTLGEMEEARALAAEALGIARENGLSVSDVAAALLVLVSAEAETGRVPDARAHADELRELVGGASGTLQVQALWVAATVCVRQGDYATAQELLQEALGRLDSRDDILLWMRLRLAAASLSLQLPVPRTEAAAAWLDEAEPAVGLVGEPQHRQQLEALRAHLAFSQGRPEQARALYDSVHASDLRLSFRDQVKLEVLHNRLLIHEGRRSEGIAGLRTLAQQVHESSNLDLAAEIWRILADHLAEPSDR